MSIDREALEASLRRLDQLAVDELDLSKLMDEVVQAAQRLLPFTGVGLMVDTGHALRHVAASDDAGRMLADVQERTGEGPCISAFVLDRPVTTSDLAADERWPKLRPLIEHAKVRAVLSAPVHVSGGRVGTIDAYQDHSYEWDADDVAAVTGYATVLENLLAVGVGSGRSPRRRCAANPPVGVRRGATGLGKLAGSWVTPIQPVHLRPVSADRRPQR
jgi:hypothetical protein